MQRIRIPIDSSTSIAMKNTETRIFPNDVFLVSYPKSGNTWVRFLFANLLKKKSSEIINFHNIHNYCTEWESQNKYIQQLTPPRILKSHQNFNPSFSKTICIVRDGRDVYVSYQHYLKKSLPSGFTFKDFIADYSFPYGRWSTHVASWINGKLNDKENFKIIRYEDLLKNPFSIFLGMVEFANLNIERFKLEEAVKNSKFEQMQDIEQQYGRKYSNDATERFIRKGISGEWAQCFEKAEWKVFQDKEDIQLLQELGYYVLE